MKPVELKKDIHWVGAVDWNIRDFHGYSTKEGSTYNSYLIMDEKITLFDGVKKGFTSDLFHRIHKLVEPEKIDYLVVNHVEPDHSGGLPEIIERIKPEKVFCSPMGKKALLAHYNGAKDWPLEVVKTGESLKLGRHTVQFVETRMLHWPDSMFSYIPEAKLLISNDAFGLHWATSERFDDQVDTPHLMEHAAKYYANILLLYSPLVQKVLGKVKELGLEIDMIAPDHGVIWRGDPSRIIKAYDSWSKQECRAKGLVIYDTMWHSTEKMAKAVAEGLVNQGLSAKLMNLKNTHRSDVMTELLDAKVLVFGSPTLNNNILPTVADFLTYAKGLKPTDRLAGAFGSYGWSGEAVKQIAGYLEDMKLQMPEPGVKVQYVPGHDSLAKCVELGEKLGKAAIESGLPACTPLDSSC
jgi:flavorubredoxin